MEDIDLMELLRYYFKKLPIIILVTLLALLVGYFYIERVQVPMYHGTTTIILVQKTDDNRSANVTQNELNLNEKLVSTYSQIIKSRRVLEQVIQSLSLDIDVDSLAKKISVTSVSETPIIKVSVSDKDNSLAALIANELADVFKVEISKIYNLENISVIDKAIVEDIPYNIHFLKQMVIYGGIGLVISCACIFIVFYFDNTIKGKKEIESKLNLAVLGEIPIANKLEAMEKRMKKKGLSSNSDVNFVDVDTMKTIKVKKSDTVVSDKRSKKKKGGQ